MAEPISCLEEILLFINNSCHQQPPSPIRPRVASYLLVILWSWVFLVLGLKQWPRQRDLIDQLETSSSGTRSPVREVSWKSVLPGWSVVPRGMWWGPCPFTLIFWGGFLAGGRQKCLCMLAFSWGAFTFLERVFSRSNSSNLQFKTDVKFVCKLITWHSYFYIPSNHLVDLQSICTLSPPPN